MYDIIEGMSSHIELDQADKERPRGLMRLDYRLSHMFPIKPGSRCLYHPLDRDIQLLLQAVLPQVRFLVRGTRRYSMLELSSL